MNRVRIDRDTVIVDAYCEMSPWVTCELSMDETESEQAILERANAGDLEAQNAMGRLVIARGGPNAYSEAEAWFLRAAEQGLSKAKHNLGVLYLRTGRVHPDAVKWFAEAAHEGWLPSYFAMGAICRDAGDMDRAQTLFTFAAQRGHAESQDALAAIYFGRESDEDYMVARSWSEAAAEQGIASAEVRLATIFHEGLGTPRDPQRAAGHFRTAACQGHAGAQAMLGVAYDVGAGVPVDKVEAAHWLMRAAQQGHALADIYLPTVIQLLQRHEIEEAERRSREPLPSP
jgi:TPR repeat protein